MIAWPSLTLRLCKWHAQELEQPSSFFVVARGGNETDLEPARLVDPVVVDLREHQLLPQTQRVIAAPVERVRRNASKVPDAGHRGRGEAVDELVHPLAAEGHHRANR